MRKNMLVQSQDILKKHYHSYENHSIAIKLIRYQLRPPQVNAITGINVRELRDIWKEIHGYPPPKGMQPQSSAPFFLQKDTQDASAFINVFENVCELKKNDTEKSTITRLIEAYDIYCSIMEKETQPFTSFYYLIKDYKYGNLPTKRCKKCKCIHISKFTHRIKWGCPFC